MSQNNMNSTILRIYYKRDERKQNLVRIKKELEKKEFKIQKKNSKKELNIKDSRQTRDHMV